MVKPETPSFISHGIFYPCRNWMSGCARINAYVPDGLGCSATPWMPSALESGSMKSLVDLLECLLLDCGRKCAAPTARDLRRLRDRVDHEGDGFITISLPRFCRDFEKSLADKRVSPGSFASFRRGRAGIPLFLEGFLSQVFDSGGVLLAEPKINCIRAVRQLCLFGKKVQRPCSPQREKAAIDGFRQIDDGVASSLPGQLGRWYVAVAKILCLGLRDERGAILANLRPRHGPGATREGITGNGKYRHVTWHERLERVGLSFLRYGRSTQWRDQSDFDAYPRIVDPGSEVPVRVIFVPKTQTSPRTIAIEPVCMQYTQQGLRSFLYRRLARHRVTAGRINFRDQSVNQRLAKEASGHGRYATLDMSEASDRVSLTHAHSLLKSAPDLWGLIMACRSTRAELPNGDIISLKKFASMGSALCFPLEAMVFFTAIVASRLNRAGLFPTARNVYSFSRDVYVYGDDLIVPADEAAAICDDLEAFKLKVNRHKSFWTGKFRESCGADYYDNERVTPVYLRRDLPANRRDVSGLLSAVSTSNQLEEAGYTVTATAIRDVVERIVGKLPTVAKESPAIGWFGSSQAEPRQRWNADLQRRESLQLLAVPLRKLDPLTGYPALHKALMVCGRNTVNGRVFRKHSDAGCQGSLADNASDPHHLDSSVRRRALALKRVWVPSVPRSN